MSDVMIEVEGLTKNYGPTRAVDQVTFSVRRGEVLGFLGPNGAGKSTTMKMLTCFLAPTAGRAVVAGHDVFDDSLEVRKRIGYLPEDTPIYRDMTVVEYLQFAADDARDGSRQGRRAHQGDRRSAAASATSPASWSASCRRATGSASGWRRRCCTTRTS